MEKECKSLKFSTYYDNVESIALNEKIGFSKIKEWSYLELDLAQMDKESQQKTYQDLIKPSFSQFSEFIKRSSFFSEMGGFLCQGWKVFDCTEPFLTELYKNADIIAIYRDK